VTSDVAVAVGGTDNEQVFGVLLKGNMKNLVEHYFEHSMRENRQD